ncbi:FAD/NAD(P)-binding protein [Demequina aurantiaca]|uniref:FAD/NAD(P)-binding protein n=1 Tax=Demequina aurantiaca TaxID=676200 RepID=UPI0007809868|nr:FAD/NAD(P)-binding protein [Demequina aurantiaca]
MADLVVVGGGPRALYALADLDDELARRDCVAGRRRLRVTVLETGTTGAGAVWEPSQPDHLLMNVDSRIVDASCASVSHTFEQWQGGDRPSFPPRAEVGRYLAWAFSRLSESPRLEVTRRRARVTAVRSDGGWWLCETEHADGQRAAPERSRHVLLATGHAGGANIDHAAMADASRGPAPGVEVVVLGASLTAFDVVMDLTVGRGGAWVEDDSVIAGVRYVRAGAEPSSITLVSRSGEPMLPKPVNLPASVPEAVREHTSGLLSGSTPDDAWWSVLADAAVAAAEAAGVNVSAGRLWERLDGPAPQRVDERWDRDVARAVGQVDDDPAWWWGRAWSAGYADVVRSLERAPRDRASWMRWRARAVTLERWAFGPPLDTHRRLLALREAGLLRVVRGTGPAVNGAQAVVIDAFTRAPGVSDSPQPWNGEAKQQGPGREPWDGLLADGNVMVRPGERGVLTSREATCVNSDGALSEGLATLGRPTEDPVIGHDSLQRRLHGDSRRWARALASTWLKELDQKFAEPTKVGTRD